MSLTEYNLTDKRIWNAGRDYERERIIQIIQNKAITANAPTRLLSELTVILAEIKVAPIE